MALSGQPEIRLKGVRLSPGLAVGRVCLFNEDRHRSLPVYKVGDAGVEREMDRVKRAIRTAGEQLDGLRHTVAAKVGHAEAGIFVAQKAILNDPTLLQQVAERIRDKRDNAETAISEVLNAFERRLQAVEDEYIRERASDIGEVRRRLLDAAANLRVTLQCDDQACAKGLERVVVAVELTPSLTVEMDVGHTRGFVTERGGVNSHAAILARGLGVPAVSGIPGIRGLVECNAEIVVNGTLGEVILNPTAATLAGLGVPGREAAVVRLPVSPVDGFVVQANLNLVSEIPEALAMQAEGVGLYRTEFEIMAAGRFFTEDELYERYAAVVKAMDGRPVVFRLLDIGSDKTLPFMGLPEEQNPALGWRGARLLLGRRDLFGPQARALARAAQMAPLDVMYPMVVDGEQFRALRAAFQEETRGLTGCRIRHGTMFEVPSACWQADELLSLADFASVGTNDLIQYLFAVDRDNERVAGDYNPDHPVLWEVLTGLAAAARRAGKPLSVCGEVGGEPRYAARLLAAGISRVSISARRIPDVRRAAAAVLPQRGDDVVL